MIKNMMIKQNSNKVVHQFLGLSVEGEKQANNCRREHLGTGQVSVYSQKKG
jgi:hypothetical protein